MFLLVSVRHVGGHPDGHQYGVSVQISINFGKTFLPTIVRKSSDILYTKYFSDLNLGESLCIFTSFHFPDSVVFTSACTESREKGLRFLVVSKKQ